MRRLGTKSFLVSFLHFLFFTWKDRSHLSTCEVIIRMLSWHWLDTVPIFSTNVLLRLHLPCATFIPDDPLEFERHLNSWNLQVLTETDRLVRKTTFSCLLERIPILVVYAGNFFVSI